VKFFTLAILIAASAASASAAELIMFEQAGCAWCEAFDREIGPIYAKTDEGKRAPLRRLDIASDLPSDLRFLTVERLTPLFILVDKGREIGRIRGYTGEDHFWGLLASLLKRLDTESNDRAWLLQKPLHAGNRCPV